MNKKHVLGLVLVLVVVLVLLWYFHRVGSQSGGDENGA